MSEPAPPRRCFEVLTLFPAAIEGFLRAGLLGRAIDKRHVQVHCTDYRDFAVDRHRTVDDAPFGGGAGMVLKPGPVVRALEHVEAARGPFHRVLLTPSAPRFDQRAAARLAQHPRIGLLCGRYEGIDDRVREYYADECLSLGDFVLNGGEVAALAIIEAVARLVDGVVGNPESVWADSFGHRGEAGLLEHPHYTRPAQFEGHAVPAVLLGGDHQAIERWRRREALRRTWALRPDLRPRRRLPMGHPVHLAVSDHARPDAEALAAVVREHGLTGLAVVGADPAALEAWLRATGGRAPVATFADPRSLRRRLRRSRGGAPRFVQVIEPGAGPEPGGEAPRCARPEVLLDVLWSAEEPGGLGPVVLWLGPGPMPEGMPAHAIYAPAGDHDRDDLTPTGSSSAPPGLAVDDAIAAKSPARSRTATLARAALTRLLDRG